MSEYIALPFSLQPMPKVSYIVDRLVEHENWWSDFQVGRREGAMFALTNPSNIIYEFVRRPSPSEEMQPVGICLFSNIEPYADCLMKYVFFDGRLSDARGKLNALRHVMLRAFRDMGLNRISLEIPEFADREIAFARKRLGFRFEAEERSIMVRTLVTRRRVERRLRTPHAPEAAVGSRKYRIVRYHGEWYDLMLLSIMRDEFFASLWSEPSSEGAANGIQSVPALQVGIQAGEVGSQGAVQEAGPPTGNPPGPNGLPQGPGGSSAGLVQHVGPDRGGPGN